MKKTIYAFKNKKGTIHLIHGEFNSSSEAQSKFLFNNNLAELPKNGEIIKLYYYDVKDVEVNSETQAVMSYFHNDLLKPNGIVNVKEALLGGIGDLNSPFLELYIKSFYRVDWEYIISQYHKQSVT